MRLGAGERWLGRLATQHDGAYAETAHVSAREPVDPGSRYERIYRVVRRIPRGRVATYGQVAELAGFPGQARSVGYALSALDERSVPWQRVVNAQGKISTRAEREAEELQRVLLEGEGVEFSSDGSISLPRFGWRPRVRKSSPRD